MAVETATGAVATEKVAPVELAATVTLCGTWAMPGLLLERLTTAPPAGAGPLSVTVPTELPLPTRAVGLKLSEEIPADGSTVSTELRVTFSRVAEIVTEVDAVT